MAACFSCSLRQPAGRPPAWLSDWLAGWLSQATEEPKRKIWKRRRKDRSPAMRAGAAVTDVEAALQAQRALSALRWREREGEGEVQPVDEKEKTEKVFLLFH